jgi:hypothetical protein
MYGQNHCWCNGCGHAVYAHRGGCGTCGTPLSRLMLFDLALDQGFVNRDVFNAGGIGFDPFDGEMAFGIPGTDLAIEPDGQVDVDFGGVDIPLGW